VFEARWNDHVLGRIVSGEQLDTVFAEMTCKHEKMLRDYFETIDMHLRAQAENNTHPELIETRRLLKRPAASTQVQPAGSPEQVLPQEQADSALAKQPRLAGATSAAALRALASHAQIDVDVAPASKRASTRAKPSPTPAKKSKGASKSAPQSQPQVCSGCRKLYSLPEDGLVNGHTQHGRLKHCPVIDGSPTEEHAKGTILTPIFS
jgi:hypothetical protein